MLKQIVVPLRFSAPFRRNFSASKSLRSCLSEPRVDRDCDDPNRTNEAEEKRENALKYGELVLAKIYRNQLDDDYSCKMFRLKKNGVLSHKYFDIFHEHIVGLSGSVPGQSRDEFFRFKPRQGLPLIEFKRPTLYEFTRLKDHSAVPSHYSILSLVPLLLEIGRRSRVLECGTGAGAMTLFLSERLGPRGSLDTYDVMPGKEEKARNKFNEWKSSFDSSAESESDKWPANVNFGTLDFVNHEFETKYHGYYDAIYLDMLNLEKALPKAYKLLKQNGILVVNAMHLTQCLKCMNVIKQQSIRFENELVLEPSNRIWELRGASSNRKPRSHEIPSEPSELDWTCRLEDRYGEKFKRGGLFFNYWQGFLMKFRKAE